MIILIILITILIAIVALYSRAWSLGGIGININIWLIIAFNLALVVGGVIAFLSDDAIIVILNIITFILGILGVAICTNEILFLFRIKALMFRFFKLGTF